MTLEIHILAQKCGGVKQVNWSPTLSSDNVISNDHTDINQQ